MNLGSWEVIVPWIISIAGIGMTYWVARISKEMQRMLSSKDKEVQLIDSRLACLREDMVRFYEAFVTDPIESVANVLVAYEIIVANPLANKELCKAVYKAREFTIMTVWEQRGVRVTPDETIEEGDTFQSVIDDVGLAYRRIVETEHEKRLTILRSKK